MSAFADASALVKLYVPEPGHGEVRAVGSFYASALSRVEVPSALWRRARAAGLSGPRAAAAPRAFEADYFDPGGRLAVVALTPDLLDEAAGAVARHDLRAGDAIQLASALRARRLDPGCDTFACFDGRLRSAAGSAGFGLLPA